MRPSLQHVAEHLGLHRSTVSRALRRDPRISAETRKRVAAGCAELGYRPSSILSELGSSRWQASKAAQGSVMAYISCTLASDDSWALRIPAMREQAASLGYGMETFRRIDFSSSAKLERVLRNRGITDIIIGPIVNEANTVELGWKNFICVQLLPALIQLPFHSVVKDHFSAVVTAWQKAVDRGYQRIGIILYDHPIKLVDDLLRAGATDVCQKFLSPQLPALPAFHVRPGSLSESEFAEWVKRYQPDLLIGFTEMHHYLYRKLFDREVAYITLHREGNSKFAGVEDAVETCAREGVNLLHYCRRTYQWGIPQQRIDHVIKPIWFEGETLPQKRGS